VGRVVSAQRSDWGGEDERHTCRGAGGRDEGLELGVEVFAVLLEFVELSFEGGLLPFPSGEVLLLRGTLRGVRGKGPDLSQQARNLGGGLFEPCLQRVDLALELYHAWVVGGGGRGEGGSAGGGGGGHGGRREGKR
jgi:hypothetical protein